MAKGKKAKGRLSTKEQRGLSIKQRRKLPLALRKAILKKKGR